MSDRQAFDITEDLFRIGVIDGKRISYLIANGHVYKGDHSNISLAADQIETVREIHKEVFHIDPSHVLSNEENENYGYSKEDMFFFGVHILNSMKVLASLDNENQPAAV